MNIQTPRPAFADAQAALPFVIAQGRNIERTIYRRRYPSFNYGAVVPIVTEGNQWAIGTQFMTLDIVGEADFISGAANDIPFNSMTRDMHSHDFAMIGSGWEWTMEQVNQAALYGVDLTGTEAMGATDSLERLLYNIAMKGSTRKGWTGFVNDPNVPKSDVATNGISTFWKDKTVDEIMADINDLLSSIRTNTGEVEWADTLALPPDAFRLISTKRLGAGDGTMSLLDFIRKNNIYTAETGQQLSIIPVRELATASPDGGGRMVAYRRDEEVLKFHLPMPRTVIPVHQKSMMMFEQGVIARTGGTEWRLPQAASYGDEITPVPA